LKWIDYHRPSSVDEAVGLLSRYKGKARMLAGGTDLLVQMRGGRYELDAVIDGKHIEELNVLSYDSTNGLTLGAAVPCYKLYGDETIAAAYPGLMDSATLIGGIQIQGRATFGGNLVNAAPSGDSIPALIAHSATAKVVGPNGSRDIPAEEVCTGPGRTQMANDEILVSIHVPAPAKGFGARYIRFIPRNEMDIAVVGAGVSVTLNNGTIQSARVALASVAPTPIFVKAAGAALAGKEPTDANIQAAANAAKEAATPITDMRGTVEYRKHLCEVLTRRALHTAIERAREAS
jgi:CO/xanthine dehydrogenase FAD-binding subunit